MQQERLPFTVRLSHVKMTYMLLRCAWRVLWTRHHAIAASLVPVWRKIMSEREFMGAYLDSWEFVARFVENNNSTW